MPESRRKRRWVWPGQLKRVGALGMNERNLLFIMRLNQRALYPRVDDKSLTKRICDAEDVPVPRTYAIIERFGDVRRLGEMIADRPDFVMKPASGAGGRGVLVIARHDASVFHTSSGKTFALSEVRHQLSTTLSGLYSLGGKPDKAIIEERIIKHPVFEKLAFGGTPDIRIIVCRSTPIMAMLRLPTRASGGRANLHQGAIGLGVDMDTGQTTTGVHNNRTITHHPDSGEPLNATQVPFWDQARGIAERLSKALGLGYVGVDIVLDVNRGPVVLEANARPGLAIQIANATGLLNRIPPEMRR